MSKPKRPANAADAPRLHDSLRLSANGVGMVLGDLEARVLRAVWAIGRPATARAIHDRIVQAHAISPLTTITVLNRLVVKGVLGRDRASGAFEYVARMNETAFMAHASRRVVEGILSFGPDAVASLLVDVLAERDPAQLEALARLIRRRLRERGEE
ncbi:MAG: BlaI/MecI/CopY family transcriptional regulator [Gemmatimonadetes bacterium]|nr:BlaI/MecI/CopY family transcriptional regulator [Gemmatimonadota bacterium]